MKQSELSFSYDGGATWEVIGIVTDVAIDGLELFEPADQVILVHAGRPFGMLREITGAFDLIPQSFDYPKGTVTPQSKPWLKPKKGRGRQL